MTNFLLSPFLLHAQPGLNTNWFFGAGHSINFSNSNNAAPGGIPDPIGHTLYWNHEGEPKAQLAVSDSTGILQFFVQIRSIIGQNSYNYTYNTAKVFDRNGNPMPNGAIEANLNTGGTGTNISPLAVPHPAKSSWYYLFYSNNRSLMYSIVDMSLNNGLGDIIDTAKDKKLTGYSVIDGLKITLVPGCSQLWLVVRSKAQDKYLSFEFTQGGLQSQPVISDVGLLPPPEYYNLSVTMTNGQPGAYGGGTLRSSNSGRLLVAGTGKGIELYDFEPCSGVISNPRMADTAMPVYGLCFSPDDTKLYASSFEHIPLQGNSAVPGISGAVPLGRVYQYDMNQANIAASRTLVLENPIKVCRVFSAYTDTVSSYIGELKLGPDGKIYMASNTKQCSAMDPAGAIPVPPSTYVVLEQQLHVIHQPDLPGLACQPELNYLALLGSPVTATGFMLQHDIKRVPKQIPDTIAGDKSQVTVCFKSGLELNANDLGACYVWDDGTSDRSRIVDHSGIYWVRYRIGCDVKTDTFSVRFVTLPAVPQLSYGCPGDGRVNIDQPVNDTTTFHYTLTSDKNDSISAITNSGYSFTRLSAGNYELQIKAGEGCDTILKLELIELPKPDVTASPSDTIVHYGSSVQLNAQGALMYVWWPTAFLDTSTSANPLATPLKPVKLTVLGLNEYGCRDTAYVDLKIDYNIPDGMPNAFSPNGDGINDVFRVSGITYQRLGQFSIFNRFGQEVFRTTSVQEGWNGTFQGKACDAGTYYYLVQLIYPDGQVRSYKGNLSLIR